MTLRIGSQWNRFFLTRARLWHRIVLYNREVGAPILTAEIASQQRNCSFESAFRFIYQVLGSSQQTLTLAKNVTYYSFVSYAGEIRKSCKFFYFTALQGTSCKKSLSVFANPKCSSYFWNIVHWRWLLKVVGKTFPVIEVCPVAWIYGNAQWHDWIIPVDRQIHDYGEA